MGSSMSSCYRGDNLEGFVPIARNNSSWRVFTYKELYKATNGFNEAKKLGEESSGSVYRGKTIDGLQIAVKKPEAMNFIREQMMFVVEVNVLGIIHHKNVLGLRGYCAEKDQKLIVYDYMPNLNLFSHLHGQFANELQLDWKRRMNIAIGCAEGLLYLHHGVTPHIIHRNIKARNVLLDSNFEPVVAGFKIAKLIPDGVDQITTRVKGTQGYLAPEYAMWGKVSMSCDIYSFGILLLELVTGRKPIENLPGGIKRTVIEWAEPFIVNERFKDLVDPKLRGSFNENQLKQVINIATLCAQEEPEKRPNMKEVVNLLKGDESTGGKLLQIRVESIKNEEDTMALDKANDDVSHYEEEDSNGYKVLVP